MRQFFDVTILFLWFSGLLLLPIGLGSAAAAVALLASLAWVVERTVSLPRNYYRPRFQQAWLFAAFSIFALFALTAEIFSHLIYGFNTFAFILALGVYWRCRLLENSWFARATGVALAGLVIGAAWAMYQHDVLAIHRITAYIAGGPNLVGRIAVLLAAFSTTLLLLEMNKWLKLLGYTLAISTGTLIVLYSGSHGSLLALPLMLVLPIMFALPLSWLKSVPAWSAVLFLVLGLTGLMYWWDHNYLITSTLNRLYSIAAGEGMDSSTLVRYQMWQVAFQSFLEHPIIGTGWHSFFDVAQGSVLENYAKADAYFNFHADIANFAVAGGIVGLLIYFFFLFAPLIFWDTSKNHPYFRVRLYWAVTMPILYFVLGLTDMVMGFDYPTMFYAFSFAMIWGLTEQKTK